MQKRYFELVLTPEGCMFYLRSEHNLSEEESKEAYEAGNTFIKKISQCAHSILNRMEMSPLQDLQSPGFRG